MDFFNLNKGILQIHSKKKLSRHSFLEAQQNPRKTIEIENYRIECDDHEDEQITGETIIKEKGTNQLIFQGLFRHNQRNGYGVEYDNNGRPIYEGQFRDDQRDGWGRLPNFEGQLRDGEYEGWGRFSTTSLYYEGYFHHNNFDGFGIQVKAKSKLKNILTLIEQENLFAFLMMRLEKSRQEFFYQHQVEELYIGEWSHGFKNGFGKLWTIDNWHTGQYAKDKPHGYGALYTYASDNMKKGTFVMGEYKS